MKKSIFFYKSLFLLLSVCLILISQNWIYFFYDSTKNDDYFKYYSSLLYFLGNDVDIEYGQGQLYYFLISRFVLKNVDYLNVNNIEIVFSSGIQNLNLIIFVFSLLGIFFLLTIENVDFKNKILILIFISFFPQLIFARSVMKPEIAGMALLFWSFYYLNLYKQSNKIFFVFLTVPFLTLLMTLKASISLMATIFLLIYFREFLFFKELKKLILPLILFLISLVFTLNENYRITNQSFFNRPIDVEYQYRVNPNAIYKFDLIEVFQTPNNIGNNKYQIKNVHSDKILNILLLDTVGDHFNQYFDSNNNYFFQDRKEIFSYGDGFIINKSNQLLVNENLSNNINLQTNSIRKLISVLYAFIFYLVVFILSIKYKKKRVILLSPFIGVFVLYLSALGVGGLNYNLYKGDTFKTMYFVFFLAISTIYILAILFKNTKFKFNLLIVFVFLASVFFIAGNPKADNQHLYERKIAHNEYSLYCEFNNIFLFNNKLIDKFIFRASSNNLSSDCDEKTISKNYFVNKNKLDNNKFLTVCQRQKKDNLESYCNYLKLFDNSLKENKENFRYPIFSIFNLILIFFISFGTLIFEIKKAIIRSQK